MIFTRQSTLRAQEIEDRIKKDAKNYGLVLKKHFPFSKNLPKSGFEIKEYASVFELCKGSVAAKLLNSQPELNILMPCRISVYEKNSQTYISTPDLNVQLEALDCEEYLKKEILGLYENILTMIKKW